MARAVASPPVRFLIWIGFAAVFFQAGESFTTWLLEPARFAGGAAWLWVGLFPLLVPLFFVVGRHLGCVSGRCRPNGNDRAFHFPPGH